MTMYESPILTVAEAADFLRVSRQRVYELCWQSVLPHIRLGKQIRIPRQKLIDFIDQQLKEVAQ